LDHVVRHVDGLEEQHPSRDVLEAIALRLSGVVREVRCEEACPPEPLEALLDELSEALEGKPLTGNGMVAFFAKALGALPADISGLVLTADRGSELVGVVLGLASGSVPLGSGHPTHWFRVDYVSMADKVLLSERGRMDSIRELGEDYGRLLAKRSDAALSAGRDVPVMVRLEWVRATGNEE